MEYGYVIWHVECKKFLQGRFTGDSVKRNIRYEFDLLECRRSDGRLVAQKQQKNTHFSMERRVRTMN
jgi:hypothetical protein